MNAACTRSGSSKLVLSFSVLAASACDGAAGPALMMSPQIELHVAQSSIRLRPGTSDSIGVFVTPPAETPLELEVIGLPEGVSATLPAITSSATLSLRAAQDARFETTRATVRLAADHGVSAAVTIFVVGPAGEVDTTFGGGAGRLQIDLGGNDLVNSIAIDGEDRIVVAGTTGNASTSRAFILRVGEDGVRDEPFSASVTWLIDQLETIFDVAIDARGRLIVLGTAVSREPIIARLQADGSADSGFGSGGIVSLATPAGYISLEIYSSGALSVGPGGIAAVATAARDASNRDLAIWSLDDQGQPRGSVVLISSGATIARNVVVLDDGSVLAVSEEDRRGLSIARLRADGELDTRYGSNGRAALTDPTDRYQLMYPKIVARGGDVYGIGASREGLELVDLFTFHLPADGAIDRSFGENGLRVMERAGSAEVPTCVASDEEGRLLASAFVTAGGGFAFAWGRFLEDGTPDPSYGGEGLRSLVTTDGVEATAGCALDRAGRFVVGGYGTGVAGSDAMLLRVWP